MSGGRRAVRGVAMNWLALGFSLCVAFFLSPFVVHRLGNAAYGVWTLVVSLISFLGLLDLGLRAAVTRYVSRHHAQDDHSNANRVISAALWLRFWIGLSAILIGMILAWLAPRHFHMPVELRTAASLAIGVAAASLAVTLLGGVFGGVLAALHRFDLLSTVTILQTTVRALGVVWLLRGGHGIVALAGWEFVVVLAANLCLVLLAYRNYPQLKIRFEKPKGEILNTIGEFSAYAFIIQICIQVMYYTDNLVVGVFVSAVGVTFYSIGGTLIEYLRQLIASVATTFLPLASKLEADGQWEKLQKLLVQGTNVALVVSLPIEVALFFRGSTFIGLWMGSQYAAESGRVLQILLLGYIFSVTTHISANIAYGMGKPKPIVIWRGGEAAVNLGLSIVLARRIGITGVAWGTVIPSLVVSLFFFPLFITRLVGMRVSTYLRKSWLPCAVTVAPFAVACFLTDRFWHAATLLRFFMQIAVILPVYVASAAFFFGRDFSEFLQGQGMWPNWLSRMVQYSLPTGQKRGAS